MTEFVLKNAYLFSHGMGYFLFEKDFSKTSSDSLSFKIKKKDLNDVLNSLMVFSSSGQISSIAYSSDIKETIKDKYLRTDDYYNYVIKNLRGQKLRFTMTDHDKIVEGNLIGGESYNSSFKKKKNVVEKYFLIYNNGTIEQVPFSLISNVIVIESDVSKEIQKALEINSTLDEEETVLKMYYSADATKSQGKAIIGFAIPISLWKTNYRIKIDSASSNAFLDSFCIINNPLNEDWTDTEISLITGRPVAFSYNLNRTDKLERSFLSPSNVSAVDPSLSEVDMSVPDEAPQFSIKPSQALDSSAGTEGYKRELDQTNTSIIKQSELNLLRYNMLSNFVKILDTSLEENFESQSIEKAFKSITSTDNNFSKMNLGQEYKFHIKGNKTIKAKENAIIPLFSNLKLPCTKLLYLEYTEKDDSPYTSIELFNEADYPLENGPCVIFEDNTPVGEAVLPTCFTSQSRIISYSKEPRVKIKRVKQESFESIKEYSFVKKPLEVVEKFTSFQVITFKITSDLTKDSEKNPTLLILDYKHPENWDVVKDELGEVKVKILENGYRFTIPIKDKTQINQPIKFKHEYSNYTALQNITKAYFSLFNNKITDSDIKKRFEENFRIQDEIENLRMQQKKLTDDKQSLERMIARIRNNLKAIPDIPGNKTRNNFVLKLNKFEEDHDRIDKELQTITDQWSKLLKQLEALR